MSFATLQSYRFNQAASAAVKLPAAPSGLAGDGEGDRSGSPWAAAASVVRVPRAAVY